MDRERKLADWKAPASPSLALPPKDDSYTAGVSVLSYYIPFLSPPNILSMLLRFLA